MRDTSVSRRRFLAAAASVACAPLVGCSAHDHGSSRPGSLAGFTPLDGSGRRVLRIGPESAPPILLLHELPGMTPDDMTLARQLGERFNVYLPLLFGNAGQDSIMAGYWQACARGEFECSALSARSAILDWLETACDRIVTDTRLPDGSSRPLGVIGMCLTGILPLALLRPGVEAAVVCQPTVPFSFLPPRPVGRQKRDLGLAAADLQRAVESPVPFLTMRYESDPLCPPERMEALTKQFGDRVAVVEVRDREGHSVLGSSFDPDAFADTVTYLSVRLGITKGPQPMKAAQLAGRRCEMSADRTWRAVT